MRLRLLGRLELERGGVSRRLPRSRKSRALLGYLAETREAHGRTWLCDLLWDGPADPRAALRWSLAKLRPLVDHPSGAGLVTQGDTVRLDTSGAFLDVTELERLLVGGLAETSTDALRAGRDLFRGTFLAGLELDGCYRFDAWLTARREAYRRLRSDVLAELLRRAGDDPEAALPLALDRLRVDPHREDAYLQVARILLAQARPDEAWMQLERARLMLEEGLGVAPSEELLALRRQLEAVPSRPQADAPAGPAAAVALATARRSLRRGRAHAARALALRALERMRSLSPEAAAEGRLSVLEVLVHPGMSADRPGDLMRRLARAAEAARNVGRADLERFAFYLMANLAYQTGDFDGALRRTLDAEGSGGSTDPATTVRSLGDTARCLGMLERYPDRAARLCEEALALAGAVEEPIHEVEMALALVRRHEGRYDDALHHLARALTAIREDEDDWWEATCLLWAPMLHLERGCPLDALVACGELRAVTWRQEQGPDAAFGAGLEGVARTELEGTPPTPAMEAALTALRRWDSRWMLAYLQLRAAYGDRRAGRRPAATRRAEDALTCARVVSRHNEIVLARTCLASLALDEGRAGDAHAHLDALPDDGIRMEWLSKQARTSLATTRAYLGEVGGGGG